jgi:hypothetical protein
MKAFWSDTRPNGQAIEAGTFCRVIDLEDGTHPIYVYGKTEEEVFEKIERQNANAQTALLAARRAAASPPAAPRVISADQVMQATEDLKNPAKSASAIATLMESSTGVNPIEAARQAYASLALAWEEETTDFFPHPGNRQMVGEKAIRMAGNKPGLVTRDTLNAAFQSLRAEGLLFERTGAPTQNSNDNSTLTTFPGENPVQRSERPRGTRFATGIRSSNLSASQTVQTRGLKYTESQIRTMPEKERRRVFDDPDYIAACEYYYSQATATA